MNVLTGAAAFLLASRPVQIPADVPLPAPPPASPPPQSRAAARGKRGRAAEIVPPPVIVTPDAPRPPVTGNVVMLTSVALALSGFAAMGMEILWFRHFTLLLGGFRAIFSLLLTVILVGTGAGSLAGSFLIRRTARPAQWLIGTLGLFVATTLVVNHGYQRSKASLMLIDGAHWLGVLLIQGAVIGLMGVR